ncbi:MAG TPA: hypothetical protein P5132_01870 [Bacteroidales bacterium]|nr:hypothetical protein [Bacteroidales bacterium]
MEKNFEKVNAFVKANQDKIKTPMFVASAIVFLAFILLWGISENGYFSGIVLLSSIISDSDFYNMSYGGEGGGFLYFIYILLIPLSSGYLMYSSWIETKRFVLLAKLLLLFSIAPLAIAGLVNPLSLFGLFISALCVLYIFLPKIGNKIIEKAQELIKEQKNKTAN